MDKRIFWCDEGIHIKHNGDLTLNDILSLNRLISNNPKYASIKYQITDFLGLTSLSMSKKDIESLSEFHVISTLLKPNLKLAIVSDNNDIREKSLKYIDSMKSNEREIKLFDNLVEAKEWCEK